MRRVQQKISQGLEVLTFFTMRQWLFDSAKFQQVFNDMESEDQKMQVQIVISMNSSVYLFIYLFPIDFT